MKNDILEQIKAGDVSGVQFNERALDRYDIGCKLVAFSNARGGKPVVGVNEILKRAGVGYHPKYSKTLHRPCRSRLFADDQS